MEFLRKYSPLFTFGILAIAIVALIIGQFRNVRTEIKDVRTELKAEIKDVRTELKAEIKDVRVEIKNVKTELTARMDRTDSKIDRLGDKIDALILSFANNRKPARKPQ